MKVGMTAYDVIKSMEMIDSIKSLADRIKDSLENADAKKANTYAYALAEAAEELRKRTQADYYAEIEKN